MRGLSNSWDKEIETAKTQHDIVELWVNSTPDSNFAGQTIVVNTNGYSVNTLFFEMGDLNSSYFRGKEVVPVEVGHKGLCEFGTIDTSSRFISYIRGISTSVSGDDITITFGDCMKMQQTSLGSPALISTDNSTGIPMRILALINPAST